jgi:RimJ/RimL family protein N-acetyltransferase
MSFSTAPISAEAHARWFEKALSGQARRLFIAESDGAALGVLRLDFRIEERRTAEVGINLAESARGRGLAVPALAALSREARSLGVSKLVARIKPENAASRRAFERAGYSRIADAAHGDDILRYELSLDPDRA